MVARAAHSRSSSISRRRRSSILYDRNLVAFWHAKDWDSGNSRINEPINALHAGVVGTPVVVGFNGKNSGYVSGVAGNYWSTPAHAKNQVTGAVLDLRALVRPSDWTPGSNQAFFSKWNTAGNQRAYIFSLTAAGLLTLGYSDDGSNSFVHDSTVATSFTDDTANWVRATLTLATGVVTFYTAAQVGVSYDEPSSWTQLGDAVAGDIVTGIHNSTSVFEVGSIRVGVAQRMVGHLYRCLFYDDTTLRVDVDFSFAIASSLTFLDQVGNTTFTLTRSTLDKFAQVVDRAVVQCAALNYLTVADDALLDFDETGSFTLAVAFRPPTEPSAATEHLGQKESAGTGYFLSRKEDGALSALGSIDDGTLSTENDPSDHGQSQRLVHVASLIRDVPNDRIGLSSNDELAAWVTDTTTATLANAGALLFGEDGPMEFISAALFSRALKHREAVRLMGKMFT